MNKTYEGIFEYVKGLEIIDTHEHLPAFENLREQDTDVLKEYLTHYLNCDLISAGLSPSNYEKTIDNKLPLLERWDLVEPYWEYARNTGYARALDTSVKALYGIGKICKVTSVLIPKVPQSPRNKPVISGAPNVRAKVLFRFIFVPGPEPVCMILPSGSTTLNPST